MTKDRDKPWAAVTYEKCGGMNSKEGKCKAGDKHIAHRRHWLGGWYGMLSHKDPRNLGYGTNGPQERRGQKPKKNSKGIWHW